MNRQLVVASAIAAFAASFLAPTEASAGLIRFSTAACGGFSTCDDSSFVAGAGVPLTFNDFSVDRFGGVLPDPGDVPGDVYSADFTLSSSSSATFGGVDSALVNHANASTASSEVGPASGFDGILNIDFGSGVSAVGFGTVVLDDPAEIIRLYNGATLLGTFSPIAFFVDFNYEGFVATGGDVITRVELEGNFFAIQNIKYADAAVTPVPEPATMALLSLGLAAVARRRITRRA